MASLFSPHTADAEIDKKDLEPITYTRCKKKSKRPGMALLPQRDEIIFVEESKKGCSGSLVTAPTHILPKCGAYHGTRWHVG